MNEYEILAFCRDYDCEIAFSASQILVTKAGACIVYSPKLVYTCSLDLALYEAIPKLNKAIEVKKQKEEQNNEG